MPSSAQINPHASRFPAVAVQVSQLKWLAAEAESEHALRAWFDATAPDRTAAYLAYHASVDREEAAAHDLQQLCELVQPPQRLAGSR
jgi:hypothetical protein